MGQFAAPWFTEVPALVKKFVRPVYQTVSPAASSRPTAAIMMAVEVASAVAASSRKNLLMLSMCFFSVDYFFGAGSKNLDRKTLTPQIIPFHSLPRKAPPPLAMPALLDWIY